MRRIYRVTSTTHADGDLKADLTVSEAYEYASELVCAGFEPVIERCAAGSWLTFSWESLCRWQKGEL